MSDTQSQESVIDSTSTSINASPANCFLTSASSSAFPSPMQPVH